jgi:uncharacterized protein (DUF2141 family)
MVKLKKLFIILLFLSAMPLSSFSQFTLTIEINGLRNDFGQVVLEFSNEKGVKIIGIIKNIVDRKCIIIIKDLKPGNYTFKYFHDENKNKYLDLNWIGIPKEGYGFSNNAKGTFGPPSIEKMVFGFKGDTTLTCTPEYIKF